MMEYYAAAKKEEAELYMLMWESFQDTESWKNNNKKQDPEQRLGMTSFI